MATMTGSQGTIPANRPGAPQLSSNELKMMLGQCLKMASENKITGQNTWGLPLIEHLDDLIREDGSGQNTNFQRASVTLDAGVKIYSYRVDSVHTETFKILGGLGRAAGPGQELDGEGGEDGENVSPSKRKRRSDLNPDATLESSMEALNVKKFDLAFAVDPLFHKTSAQFDEGGARGLLLNNLSVFRGCNIVFDSMDVPEDALDATAAAAVGDARVDLEGVLPQVQALAALTGTERLSATLDDILALTGAAPPASAAAEADEFVRQVAEAAGDVQPWMPPAAAPAQAGDEGEEHGVGGEASGMAPYSSTDHHDDHNDDYGAGFDGGYDDFDDDQDAVSLPPTSGHMLETSAGGGLSLGTATSTALDEDALSWLIAAGGGSSTSYVTGAKGWAGGSHWRYRAVPLTQGDGEDEVTQQPAGRRRAAGAGARRRNGPLDFVALMAEGAAPPEFEMLPRGGRRTRRARPAAKTLLPEDHHYEPEALARYALRPRNSVAVAGGGARPVAGHEDAVRPDFTDFGDDYDGEGADAYGSGEGGGWEFGGENVGDALDLVDAARRVDKVDVNYARAAKQVDVRELKELMWGGIQAVVASGGGAEGIDFADVLATVPAANPAGRLEDLSVHLCFICVLHLANEHGLVVRGVPELDRMLLSNVPVA